MSRTGSQPPRNVSGTELRRLQEVRENISAVQHILWHCFSYFGMHHKSEIHPLLRDSVRPSSLTLTLG